MRSQKKFHRGYELGKLIYKQKFIQANRKKWNRHALHLHTACKEGMVKTELKWLTNSLIKKISGNYTSEKVC